MPVVLEPPLTGSLPQPHLPPDTALATAPRYLRTRGMSRWHRPRNGQVLGHDQRTVYGLWCGPSIADAAKAIAAETPPPGELVCGTCEGRAIGAGQDSWPVPGGPDMIFSPRRLAAPKVCPGSQSERLNVEAGRSVVRCLVCGELVGARCYGSSPWYGPAGWGARKHEPGPGLIGGCPFHAWRHLVRRGDTVECECRRGVGAE